MTDSTRKWQAIDRAVSRFWRRLPVVIRALVVGFLVAEIGIGAWLAVAALIPAPWSLVLMSAADTSAKRPVAETGIDTHFAVWALIFVASVTLFSWAARRTPAARRQTRKGHEGGEADEFTAATY